MGAVILYLELGHFLSGGYYELSKYLAILAQIFQASARKQKMKIHLSA